MFIKKTSNMLPMVLKKVINKQPFAFKIVFLLLAFYTIYSIKVDIDIYIGDTNIEIAIDDFQFDYSICNPRVIKDLLSKVNRTYDASVDGLTGSDDKQVIIATQSGNLTKHTSPKVPPLRYYKKPAGILTQLKKRNNYMSTKHKRKNIPSNSTQVVKNDKLVADTYKAVVKHSVTPNEVSGQNKPKEEHGETGRKYASSFHTQTRQKITKDEQRRLVLNAQAQSAGTNELDVDVSLSDNKKVDTFNSKNVTQKTAFNKTTTPPTRSTTRESQREKQIVTSIRKDRGRISTSRFGHSMSRPDYMSSPYYLDSIHPLHIDLVQLVRKKIEQGVKFPVDPVNVQRIDYVYKPADCKFESSLYNVSLLVIVRSDAQHLDMRSMIRSTWGNISMYPNVRLVFTMGVEVHSETNVHEESVRYRDILQGIFVEDFFSSANKTTMALTWANGSCPDADVILLTDDDHLVKIKNILEYIKTFNRLKLKNMFAGFFINNSEVQRTTKSPWSVKWTEFPHKFWPPYPRKGCMLISREVARQLTEAFPYVKYVHVHDAYLGIVARKLALVPQNDIRFFQTVDNLLTTPNYFAYEGFNSSKLLNVSWYSLTRGSDG